MRADEKHKQIFNHSRFALLEVHHRKMRNYLVKCTQYTDAQVVHFKNIHKIANGMNGLPNIKRWSLLSALKYSLGLLKMHGEAF